MFRFNLLAGIANAIERSDRAWQFDPGAIFVVILLIALVAFGVWRVWQHIQERNQSGYADPAALFQELCAAHHLDAPAVSLLTRLAAFQQVEPAVLFIDPERYSLERIGRELAGKRTELSALRDRLFATA